jgi:hypothetical protein
MNIRDRRTGLVERPHPEEHLETWFAETLGEVLAAARLCIDLDVKEQILMVATQGVMTYGTG